MRMGVFFDCISEYRRCGLIPRAIIIIFLFFAFAASNTAMAAEKSENLCDSLHINTLNMSDEEYAATCGAKVDSTKEISLQQLNEENPSYIKREYSHKQQVIVGSVVMLCVALAMVLMNNYNPKR